MLFAVLLLTILLLIVYYRGMINRFKIAFDNQARIIQESFEKDYQNKLDFADKQRKEFYEDRLNSELALRLFAIKKNFEYDFLQWKQDYEKKIRTDAVTRSQSSTVGKLTEHIIPLIGSFPYNPADARWFGSPFDLLILNGLHEGNLKEIIFAEVKTGKYAQLNKHERQLRDVIKNKQVRYEQIKIDRGDKND